MSQSQTSAALKTEQQPKQQQKQQQKNQTPWKEKSHASGLSGGEIDVEIQRYERGRQHEQLPAALHKDMHKFFENSKHRLKFDSLINDITADVVYKLGLTRHILDPINYYYEREFGYQLRRSNKHWTIFVGNIIYVYKIVRCYIVPPTFIYLPPTAASLPAVSSEFTTHGIIKSKSGVLLHPTADTTPALMTPESTSSWAKQRVFLTPEESRLSNTPYDMQILVDVIRMVFVPKDESTLPPLTYASIKKKQPAPHKWQDNFKLVKKQICELRQPYHKQSCPVLCCIDKRSNSTLPPYHWIYEEVTDHGAYLNCQNSAVTMPQHETCDHNTSFGWIDSKAFSNHSSIISK